MSKLYIALALSLISITVQAAEIIVSIESNGVLRAEGMIPGSSCTVEGTSSLLGTSNQIEFVELADLIADSNGVTHIQIPMEEKAMFFQVKVIPPPPQGMVLIPAGINNGENPLGSGESYSTDYPQTYSLTNGSVLFMDATEISKEQWDIVYSWAMANGYNFENPGAGKAADHPVQGVNWFDCLKWCNARSEMDGRTPCYTIGGSIYKTGDSTPSCNFDTNGYRLPTQQEWEYACRGGLSGKRFPRGDTISQGKANYFSNQYLDYDTTPWSSPHLTYDDGVDPYTCPVNTFSPNSYGLYNMTGNIREWCWDPPSSSWRTARGGAYNTTTKVLRCGDKRGVYSSGAASPSVGFRAVCR